MPPRLRTIHRANHGRSARSATFAAPPDPIALRCFGGLTKASLREESCIVPGDSGACAFLGESGVSDLPGGNSSRPPDWVAPLAMSEPLRSGELRRILYDATMRGGSELPESCQLRLVGPKHPEMLLGRPPGVDPPSARPIGELPDGDRDGFGQPRQPPFVRTELLRVRLRSRQAAPHHELADEVGEESAAPLRRAEPLPVEGVGNLGRGIAFIAPDAAEDSPARSRT